MKQQIFNFSKENISYVLKAMLLLLLLALSSYGRSQTKFGVKSAYGIFKASPSHIMYSNDGLYYSEKIQFIENRNATSLGLFFVKDFDFLFFQIDALYTKYDALYGVQFLLESSQPEQFELEKFRNIDFSIIAGYNWNKFDVGVGPVFHRRMDMESGMSKYDFFRDKSSNLSAGFQFSVGYTIGPLKAEIRWEDMFAKAGDHIGFQNRQRNKFSSPQSLIQFQIGLGF